MIATAAITAALPVPEAQAQSGGCPDAGIGGASVEVASPRPGEEVRGVVTVRGTVSAPLTVSRVELLVGRSLVDTNVFSAASSVDFALTWDATSARPGRTSLRVVACGQGAGGLLVHGSSTVAVEVADPLPPPPPTTTSSTTTTLSSTTTSSVPLSTTSSTSSTSTTQPVVTTTLPSPALPPVIAAGQPGRLLPARTQERGRQPRPLWVGIVVGLSGVAGLSLSRVLPGRARASE